MKKPIISIIAAIDEERGIGKNNKLLWHIKGELPRFKKLTLGHPVIMGRKTFEAILERRKGSLLPERSNIVVTRQKAFVPAKDSLFICHSLKQALELAKKQAGSDEVFVIGGGQIYEQAIDLADKLYLTIVKGKHEADTFFPDYSEFKKVISEEKHESGDYQYRFLELERQL